MSTHSYWVERIQNLPVLPQVAMRVTERMQSPTATLLEISDLIKSDPGLSSKVLRLANSSYYSIPGGVSDVSKALQYLGFTTIAQIVLTSSVFGSFKHAGVPEFPLPAFWLHCFAVGQMAELAARSLQLNMAADAFIGGLLHDAGKLILLELAPDQIQKTVRHAREHRISFARAEKETGCPSHVELGAALARHWKLPASIQNAISLHHSGSKGTESSLIEWADLWVNARGIGSSGNHDSEITARLEEARIRLGIAESAMRPIEEKFQKEIEKAEAILGGH